MIILCFAGLSAAFADDGTAHNGPHNVPGVIRAVDFNDGGSLVAYYATTPGNQGGYSGYRPDTDVDIANGPGGPYVVNSAWLKYTIEVGETGWYRVDYYARELDAASGVGILTSIDDRPFGDLQGVAVSGDFSDYWSPGLHLGAGRHTLGVNMYTASTSLDRIQISPIAAPPLLTPRIVPVAGPSTEVVVADAVVTDAPFLADPTGMRDSTQAFSDALGAVSAYGGGTVFVPVGTYRIDGTLFVPNSTTLWGADSTDRSDPSQIGSLLLASFGEGDATTASFIYAGELASVRNLSIWYPSQGFTNATVRPYPFTITFRDCCANALNLRLYNSFNGISVYGNGHVVGNIVGTALNVGLTAGGGGGHSYLYNVEFGNDTWKRAPHDRIPNAPSSDEDRLALDTYTSAHVLGAQIGLNTYGMYGLRIRDAHQGMLVKKLPGDPGGFFSTVSHIDAEIEDVDGYLVPDSGLHFLNTDNVPGVESLSYDFVGSRGPASATNFLNVKNQPFNAAGDGLADDTPAIQAALNEMSRVGGGTVYLPPGQYRVTAVTIPTGVELRGSLGGATHGGFASLSTCTLLGYGGKNTAAPASDPALLTLAPGSGVRGFDVVYPEQGYGSTSAPVVPYPFTIRGLGAGVWVENVSVANAFNLIDLASFRCDDHLVSGVVATAFNTGVLVGGGSRGGKLERIIISWGPDLTGRLSGPPREGQHGVDAVAAYVRQNTVPFVFGSCTRETTFGLDSYDVKISWRMLADGGGCTDSTFWEPNADTSSQGAFLFEGGDKLRFVGLGVSSDGPSFVSSSSFTGSVDIYGTMTWGGGKYLDLSGGMFRFHNERSLTLGKTATASSSASANEGPSSAVDGSELTKWTSATSGTNWLTVDLDQPSEIDRWVVRHAGINGEPDELDTGDFAIQVSDDSVRFSTVDSVTGNGYRLTDRPVSARGRFVRLLVTQGTASGDGRARIYEFQAHGKEGWQFTNDAEGWAPRTDISSFAATDGKLEISSSGTQPTITSADNLNIPTSKFAALRVRMRNSGAQTSAKLSFTTQADPAFGEAKSVTVSAILSSPEYFDYYFNLSDNAAWTGTLRQFRLTPIGSAGDVSIDSIALEEADPHNRNLVPLKGSPQRPRVVPR